MPRARIGTQATHELKMESTNGTVLPGRDRLATRRPASSGPEPEAARSTHVPLCL